MWLKRLKKEDKLDRLVAQGGFAGDNIVPEEKRLSKFNGRLTCPIFNLGADIKADKIVLDYPGIEKVLKLFMIH
jgi:pyrimidine-specific ribonucleoside hydrolase